MASLFLESGDEMYINLLNFTWHVINEKEWADDDITYQDLLTDVHRVALSVNVTDLQDIFPDADSVWPDCNRRIELEFTYDYKNDPLEMFPIATCIEYTAVYPLEVNGVDLHDDEKDFFSSLLQEAIGDKHTPEMRRVMIDYHNAIDKEIYNFVQGVLHGMDLPPVTVAYFSTDQCDKIKAALPNGCRFAPRVTMDADTVRHIVRRHGVNGNADGSMTDIKNIARIAYVLANFDDVKFEGNFSHKYKNSDGTRAPLVTFRKKIDGMYYIVEALCDNKRMLSYIVTAYRS